MNETTNRRRRPGRRDFGSIKADGTPTEPRFSAMWWEGGRQRRKRGFGTRTDAASFLARVRVELDSGTREAGAPVAWPEVTVSAAIEAYEKHRREKGNKAGPLGDTTYRLRTFFTEPEALLSHLTPRKCLGYYESLRTRPQARLLAACMK